MHTFSEEALERPRRTMAAADIFREYATVIAHAASEAQYGEAAVAVVRHDLRFAGVWIMGNQDVPTRVPLLEEGVWSLVFSRKVGIADIEQRCIAWSRLAAQRRDAMQVWARRQRQEDATTTG